jgi:site-specific DNA-methyltransferase (adenine-specific)
MTEINNITNNMTEVNLSESILTTLTKSELLAKCAKLKITKCKTKTKAELIDLINNNTNVNTNIEFIEEDEPTQITAMPIPATQITAMPIPAATATDQIIILNNDCLIELEKLPDNSIDCVITDPPYFIDKLDNKWSSDEVKNDVKNSHITHLPKGMKFDKSQVKNLYDYYLKLSQLLFKKMKPGAFFLSFSSPRLYHAIAMSCEIAGFEIRDMINWTYTQSMPKGMSVSHVIDKMNISEEAKADLTEEYKCFKTPQIRSCFEPICVAMKPIGKSTFIQNELNFKTGLLDFSQKVGINNDRVPANVITTEEINESYDKNFMVSKPTKSEKGEHNTHITVKPLALIEHLVKLFSKENALVVDPFLGSGTTALACKKTNRRCIGIELNAEYYEICLNRCS